MSTQLAASRVTPVRAGIFLLAFTGVCVPEDRFTRAAVIVVGGLGVLAALVRGAFQQ